MIDKAVDHAPRACADVVWHIRITHNAVWDAAS